MMPLATYLAIRPGDILRTIGSGVPRLALSRSTATVGHGWTGLSFFRIGHSWTGQNPTASYDAWAVRQMFETTGRRGCSQALASEWETYWTRLFHATLAHEPPPRRPDWPREWCSLSPPVFLPDEKQTAAHVRKWLELQRRGELLPASRLRRSA